MLVRPRDVEREQSDGVLARAEGEAPVEGNNAKGSNHNHPKNNKDIQIMQMVNCGKILVKSSVEVHVA